MSDSDRLSVRRLRARGFERNGNIQTFTGYCAMCSLYRVHEWWESPDDPHGIRGNISVCTYCQHADAREAGYVMRFPVLKIKAARTRGRGQDARLNVA